MADTTARLALPLLVPGQAQKELFHNEALASIDIALQAVVTATGLNTPPAAPVPGACWIVGPAPTDAWAGQAGALAGWTAGGWRFVAPFEGMAVWDRSTGQVARYDGGAWMLGAIAGNRLLIAGIQVVGAQQPAIASPSGGTAVDVQARTALDAILVALRTHGLVAT